MNDTIYRQDAIKVICHACGCDCREEDLKNCPVHYKLTNMPSAESEQCRRIFQEIVVEYPSISIYPEYKGKSYFSIKYVEDGQGYIGYGTYKPEVLSEYMKKYFISSAEPKIIRCKDCKHHVLHPRMGVLWCTLLHSDMGDNQFCSYAERRGEKDE